MKRAQIPLLIVALAIGLLVYVYFLPLSEKCKIMNLPECTKLGEAVFSSSPGILEKQENKVQYSLPEVELFTVGGRERTTLAEGITVSRGWFSSSSPIFSFNIHEKSQNVVIYVSIEKGSLKAKVNGKTVASIEGAGQHTISIPSSELEKTNTLQLYPSTPFFPWSVNKVNIEKLFFEESYTITQEKQTLQLDLKEDPKDISEAMLNFKSDCFFGDSNLSIRINDNEIINNVLCTGFSKDIKSMLGKNTSITFFSKGNYFIYQMKLDVKLSQSNWPTYYFDLPEKGKVNLIKLKFADSGEKELTIYFNGKTIAVNTAEKEWQSDVSSYTLEGQNEIVVIPAKTVNIESISVY